MSNKKKNASELVSGGLKTIAAIGTYLSKVPSMMLAGKTVTTSDVVAAVKARNDAIQAADAARGAWLAACDHLKVVKADGDPLLSLFERAVGLMFATQTDVLNAFGIAPIKRATPSAETTAQAVLKNKATRAARLTVGPKAKLKITAPEAPVNGKAAESNGSSTASTLK